MVYLKVRSISPDLWPFLIKNFPKLVLNVSSYRNGQNEIEDIYSVSPVGLHNFCLYYSTIRPNFEDLQGEIEEFNKNPQESWQSMLEPMIVEAIESQQSQAEAAKEKKRKLQKLLKKIQVDTEQDIK